MAGEHFPIRADSTALILMDFQSAIMPLVPGSYDALERAADGLRWARANGVMVVFVRVAFTQQDYKLVPAHNKSFAAVANDKLFALGSSGTEVDSALAVTSQDLVVRKTRVGAFSTTELDAMLRAEGIDTIVIGGISTGGAVLSSVRDAADRDYRLLVLRDATADGDPTVHRVLIENVFPQQAEVVETTDLEWLTF
jgi:nicotinamidase-related amidase